MQAFTGVLPALRVRRLGSHEAAIVPDHVPVEFGQGDVPASRFRDGLRELADVDVDVALAAFRQFGVFRRYVLLDRR